MAKILVVEDHIPIAELIKMVLLPRGYEVVLVSDGSMAVDTARQQHPDLILLDVMLPGMDGYTIQSKLLEDESTKQIPVIVMTSKSQMEEVFKASANVAGFIAKPFSVKNFVEKIEAILKKP